MSEAKRNELGQPPCSMRVGYVYLDEDDGEKFIIASIDKNMQGDVYVVSFDGSCGWVHGDSKCYKFLASSLNEYLSNVVREQRLEREACKPLALRTCSTFILL